MLMPAVFSLFVGESQELFHLAAHALQDLAGARVELTGLRAALGVPQAPPRSRDGVLLVVEERLDLEQALDVASVVEPLIRPRFLRLDGAELRLPVAQDRRANP